MADLPLTDDAQTVAGLESITSLLEWMRSMPSPVQQRLWASLAECSDAIQQVVISMLRVLKNPGTSPQERQRALMMIADALSLGPGEVNDCNQELLELEAGATQPSPSSVHKVENFVSQEAEFATRLRDLMGAKHLSQTELAKRIGCSQAAISLMLHRRCRPQKKTLLKLAEALNVRVQQLWPDIEVTEMLDAVASFQQSDHVMTEAELRALTETSKRNRSRILVKSLPTRHR